MASDIFVRWTQPGWHRWPEATGTRAYLSDRHRHLFHYEARITVHHDDREIEFHDLLDLCRGVITEEELDRASCEDLARRVISTMRDTYPDRPLYSCSVSEDGEVGATITEGASS
jgi:hypothetical protein